MYGLSVVTAPTEEPVTLTVAKAQLRLDIDDEDALITGWIRAARRYCEEHTGRRFITQTLKMVLDAWPEDGTIRFPVERVTAVDHVKYRDTDGNLQTISTANYQTGLSYTPPLLAPVDGFTWPDLEAGALEPIEIQFKAGEATALALDERVGQAILITLAYWDENRGGEAAETSVARGLPAGALRLLDSIWTGNYG